MTAESHFILFAFSIAASLLAVGLSLYTGSVWAKRARTAEAALAAMEVAHDPGRDVHQRLAAALEAWIVRADSGPPDPAGRRAAAMAMAAKMIDTCRVAGLRLVPDDQR